MPLSIRAIRKLAMSDQYQELYRTFRWLVPGHFNIAQACCHQWAANPSDARRVAFYGETTDGAADVWTYGRLGMAVSQLANGLLRMGLGQGDRLAIMLGQRAETLVAHMATYAVGAIAVPLSVQTSPDTLATRLHDAAPRTAIIDTTCSDDALTVLARTPSLQQIISLDFHDDQTIPWRSLLARQPTDLRLMPTRASDPALLLYTAGTNGPSKGVLLSHATLIGNLPGFVTAHNWFPQADDVLWTNIDWANRVALLGALLPTLYFGRPIVAMPQTYQAEQALALMAHHAVRSAVFSPAALDALRQDVPEPRVRHALALRSIAVSGAPLCPETFTWCRTALGVTPNETYGLTEANHIIGNSHAKWPAKPGSMGRPIPGHNVAILDDQGHPLPVGEIGEIALAHLDIHGAPNPILSQGYWRNNTATQMHHSGNWLRTGDQAWRDENGDFWFVGRQPA